MYLYIKNMVSYRCKLIVQLELEKLGINFEEINLGEVEINGNISEEIKNTLNANLKTSGLAIIYDKKGILIEKIKIVIIELVHYSEKKLKFKLSDYLSQKLNHDYTYLANLFSENQGITIEHFYLTHKIERAKELLIYDEFNVSEIADILHYSNVAYFSNQFKKMTGMTPSEYKHLSVKKRKPIEKL